MQIEEAVLEETEQKITSFFKQLFDDNPELYSVSWRHETTVEGPLEQETFEVDFDSLEINKGSYQGLFNNLSNRLHVINTLTWELQSYNKLAMKELFGGNCTITMYSDRDYEVEL